MLTIRERQIQVLAQGMFELWMAGHLAEFFHAETTGLDPAEIGSRIRAAVQEARRHGFIGDSQVCRYVDLSFVLGPDFDQDPSLPWAAEILGDDRVTDPEMRMDLLYEAAMDHVARAEQIEPSHEVSE